MKKLTLNTSDLTVETFETDLINKASGTVKGNQEDSNFKTYDCLSVPLYKTCGLSCGGSCDIYTCASICETEVCPTGPAC